MIRSVAPSSPGWRAPCIGPSRHRERPVERPAEWLRPLLRKDQRPQIVSRSLTSRNPKEAFAHGNVSGRCISGQTPPAVVSSPRARLRRKQGAGSADLERGRSAGGVDKPRRGTKPKEGTVGVASWQRRAAHRIRRQSNALKSTVHGRRRDDVMSKYAGMRTRSDGGSGAEHTPRGPSRSAGVGQPTKEAGGWRSSRREARRSRQRSWRKPGHGAARALRASVARYPLGGAADATARGQRDRGDAIRLSTRTKPSKGARVTGTSPWTDAVLRHRARPRGPQRGEPHVRAELQHARNPTPEQAVEVDEPRGRSVGDGRTPSSQRNRGFGHGFGQGALVAGERRRGEVRTRAGRQGVEGPIVVLTNCAMAIRSIRTSRSSR